MKERPDFSTTVTHLGQEFVLLIFWIEVKANFKASSFDKANNLLGLYRFWKVSEEKLLSLICA
ncbi:hypothetical protein T4B_14632 [Trichinella pseudospiralis]|uniref:Uncharacterized protein n=2 Tax=Trichinella pseudospiralis TaxID=6337 RepID=A0A0V1IBM2_TRIPS|nr:hypothetical protein T4A_2626 [Trichinella pseudospiralis]KRY90355.1 hypothetical protein T4D_8730 [Trichinella pseudospiralis]KRZ20252.1 hypothetical protein T4B_14632 [Trichinella pseudospiralis]KRZ39064.1 hypothetical protein T4C_10022 [Trichinella pseudospiralis]